MSCGGLGHSLFSEKNRKLARADLTVTKKNKYCAKHEQTHLVSSSHLIVHTLKIMPHYKNRVFPRIEIMHLSAAIPGG